MSRYAVPINSSAGDVVADENVQATGERKEERRTWLPWVALAVVLGVVFWLLLTYGDWYVMSRREAVAPPIEMLTVPDVTGMERSEAERLLAKEGFTAETGVSYDIISPPGTVSSQEPAGGSKLARGSVVAIEVVEERDAGSEAADSQRDEPDYRGEAKGMTSRPPRVVETRQVPDVTGANEQAARDAIEAAGLVPRFMYQPKATSIGKVFGQDPNPGERIPVGEQVHVIIGL